MGDSLLAVDDLTTRFRTDEGPITAVDGVSLSVDAGEVVGIVGESGCGKTATVRSIVRLIDDPGRIESGRVAWKGREIQDVPARELRRIRGDEIGMVFQDPADALDPSYTVGAQLVEAIRAHRDASRADAREEATELLSEVGLSTPEAARGRYPHEFSGGQRQRIAIALALANRPDLLIADEPTTGLDVTTQARILELFRDLRDRYDMAVLLISHDVGVVAEVCDRVLVMYAGRVVERGSLDAVLRDPKHPYTRALLASVPRIDGPDTLEPIGGSPPDLADPPSGCRFRTRCPDARALCADEPPPEIDFGGGHSAACYVYTEAYDQ